MTAQGLASNITTMQVVYQRPILVLIALVGIWILGCKESPQPIDDKFVTVVSELKIAQSAGQKNPEELNQARKIILARYGMDWREFNENYNQLVQNPETWKRWNQAVEKKLIKEGRPIQSKMETKPNHQRQNQIRREP